MSQSPSVSVIIPTHNCARYLPEAIDSVVAQSCQDFEIVVVDDGSTDNTKEVVASYGERVQYVYQENRGRSAARNIGVALARGRYLAFLDADDLMYPGKLEAQASYLDDHPDVGVVYSDGVIFRLAERGPVSERLFSESGFLRRGLGTPGQTIAGLCVGNAFPIHASLVRRGPIEAVGGFDETLSTAEDWDLWFRIAHRCSFAYMDGLVARYRIASGNTSHDASAMFDGVEKVRSKIERDEAFAAIPIQMKADAYYEWGKSALAVGRRDRVTCYFAMALALRPRHWRTRGLKALTWLLGDRAAWAFVVRRRFLSALRVRRRRFIWSDGSANWS